MYVHLSKGRVMCLACDVELEIKDQSRDQRSPPKDQKSPPREKEEEETMEVDDEVILLFRIQIKKNPSKFFEIW